MYQLSSIRKHPTHDTMVNNSGSRSATATAGMRASALVKLRASRQTLQDVARIELPSFTAVEDEEAVPLAKDVNLLFMFGLMKAFYGSFDDLVFEGLPFLARHFGLTPFERITAAECARVTKFYVVLLEEM